MTLKDNVSRKRGGEGIADLSILKMLKDSLINGRKKTQQYENKISMCKTEIHLKMILSIIYNVKRN